jgi:hypothetical protein
MLRWHEGQLLFVIDSARPWRPFIGSHLLSQSRLLVEFEGIMIVVQQIQYNTATGMKMGFSNKQTKENNRVINPTPNQE